MPTKSSSHRAAAPRMYSRWPLWNGWNRPWIMPRALTATSGDDDACALFDGSDAANEQLARRELRLERRPLLPGQSHEQPAGGLRVVAEHDEGLGDAPQCHMPPGEVAVAGVAAGADAGTGGVERAVDRREAFRLEDDPDAAALGHLVRVTKEPEARDKRDGVDLQTP